MTSYKLQTNNKLENQNAKHVYDLEERTAQFAETCRDYLKKIPKNIHNVEYSKQLIRSSASQAANYIEANESLSKKDFVHRIKICRKETKESCLWLRLLECGQMQDEEKMSIIKEAIELRKIFSAILSKSSV